MFASKVVVQERRLSRIEWRALSTVTVTNIADRIQRRSYGVFRCQDTLPQIKSSKYITENAAKTRLPQFANFVRQN